MRFHIVPSLSGQKLEFVRYIATEESFIFETTAVSSIHGSLVTSLSISKRIFLGNPLFQEHRTTAEIVSRNFFGCQSHECPYSTDECSTRDTWIRSIYYISGDRSLRLLLYQMRKRANVKTKTRCRIEGYSNYSHDSLSPVNECHNKAVVRLVSMQ